MIMKYALSLTVTISRKLTFGGIIFLALASFGIGQTTVEGIVLTPDPPQPIPNLSVSLTPPTDDGSSIQMTTTDAEGKFHFSDIAAGEFLLEVKQDFIPVYIEDITVTSEGFDKEIHLNAEIYSLATQLESLAGTGQQYLSLSQRSAIQSYLAVFGGTSVLSNGHFKQFTHENNLIPTASTSIAQASTTCPGLQKAFSLVPSYFTWEYKSEPAPGLRTWTRTGTAWTETWQNGVKGYWHTVGRMNMDGGEGTLVRKNDEAFNAFIPDLGNPHLRFWTRHDGHEWSFVVQILIAR